MIKITMEVDDFPENFTGIVEYPNGAKEWYKEGKFHRDNGPAIEFANGFKFWYKEGKEYTEEEFNKKINNCEGKVIEIEGKKYKLTLTN